MKIAAALLLFAGTASAQEPSYLVFDAGLSSCGKVLTAEPAAAGLYQQWAAGFMTGFSAATGSDLGGLRDVAGVMEGARKVCEEDPTKAFGPVVREVVLRAARR